MATWQRRNGTPVTLYPQTTTIDMDGVETLSPDWDNPQHFTAAVIPQRSQRAEVPGQQVVNVVRLVIGWTDEAIGPWARAEFDGREWDVVAPPIEKQHVPRYVKHMSIDVRERPPRKAVGLNG